MPEEQAIEYNFPKTKLAKGVVAIFTVYGTLSYFKQTLAIARPKIAADLNGLPLIDWSVSIPYLVGGFVTLVFEKFSDIYGRRIILMVSLAFCLAGTILAAISPNFVFSSWPA
jgi:MFS family permease